MQHQSWAGHDGAPQGVRALATDQNGLLWISTLSGLFDFDGNVFTPIKPADGDPELPKSIRFLKFDRQGGLWMFGGHGAPARLKNGRTKVFAKTDCGEIATMGDPQFAPDGVLWAAMNEQHIVTLGADDVWHCVPIPNQGEHLTKLHVNASGGVWIVLNDRLYLRRPHETTFSPTEVYVYGTNNFVDGKNADVWIASSGPATSGVPALNLQHVSDDGSAIPAPHVPDRLIEVAPDPDGSLWVLTLGNILAHLDREAIRGQRVISIADWKDRAQLHESVQLEGDQGFLVQPDGTVWVGGMGGIEFFTKARLIPLIPHAAPGYWDNCVGEKNTQWVINPDEELLLVKGGTSRKVAQGVEGLYCSGASRMFRDQQGLAILRGEGFTRLPLLPGLTGYSNHYIFTGAAQAANGDIISTAAGGAIGRSLWSFHSGQWNKLDSVGRLAEISAMLATRDGKMLLGFRDGTIASLVDGHLQTVGIASLDVGRIVGFAITSYGNLAYGTGGIARLADSGAETMTFAHPDLAKLLTGVVEAKNGDVWFNAANGISRITSSEMHQFCSDKKHEIVANNIREGDFVGPSFTTLFSNRAQRDESGRLWFSTLNGIVSVSPEAQFERPPPRLVVRGVSGDGQQLPTDRSFPPNVSVVSIGYTGIDFTSPSGLTYAYQLAGYDKGWQEVGGRTEAVYTHLKAGSYTFSVKARDAFGIWTEPVALQTFRVRPHLYERTWFLALCVCVCAGLVWLVVQLRLRAVATSIRRQAEARADERISIARDLHDTLLQGVQGLLLTLHAAAEQVPSSHSSKANLDRALISAEKLILEGRDRVKGLRVVGLSDGELSAAFESVAEDLGCSSIVTLTVQKEERRLELAAPVAAEVFLIGREALLNALQHADATRIAVRMNYSTQEFVLECEDNGKGFDSGKTLNATRDSHYGLRGMDERARKLNGICSVSTEPERGTTVTLTLSGRKIYEARL